MTKLLVVFGSPKFEEMSESSKLARHFVNEYIAVNPGTEVVEVQPSELEAFGLNGTILAGTPTDEDMKRLAIRQEILEQVKTADKIVVATPMWDFGMPGSLKEYLDAWCVAGETFKYLEQPDENGNLQKGLLENKKVMLIQTMGGMNVGENDITEMQATRIFDFIGMNDHTYAPVQGTNIPGMYDAEKEMANIAELAKKF